MLIVLQYSLSNSPALWPTWCTFLGDTPALADNLDPRWPMAGFVALIEPIADRQFLVEPITERLVPVDKYRGQTGSQLNQKRQPVFQVYQ